MRRTDLQDTSEEAHRILTQRLREMTIAEKVKLLSERIEEMRALRKHTQHLRDQGPKRLLWMPCRAHERV